MSTQQYQRRILRPHWNEAVREELNEKTGIPAVVRKHSALADWTKLRGAPSGRAEDELFYALQIATSEYDHPLVQKCLERSIEVFTAGERDERWSTWWSACRNIDHGRFLSAGELARAWSRNGEPSMTSLRDASKEILQGALEDRPVWTEMAQSEYVHGTQLLLIAGDLQLASDAFLTPKKFTRVEEFYEWHRTLVGLLQTSSSMDKLVDHFDRYFDELRHPRHEVGTSSPLGENVLGLPLARLRLALIRWIYIERQPIAGNWRQIIGQIGY